MNEEEEKVYSIFLADFVRMRWSLGFWLLIFHFSPEANAILPAHMYPTVNFVHVYFTGNWSPWPIGGCFMCVWCTFLRSCWYSEKVHHEQIEAITLSCPSSNMTMLNSKWQCLHRSLESADCASHILMWKASLGTPYFQSFKEETASVFSRSIGQR